MTGVKNTKKTVTVVSVALLISVIVCAIAFVLREEKLDTIQKQALAALERDSGQYDEQSIVLQGTSFSRANMLAEKLGAELRISQDGKFATLTLPESATIRDVFADEDNKKYIEEMAADYMVSVADYDSQHDDHGERHHRIPKRPKHNVVDDRFGMQSYLDYINLNDTWSQYTGKGITIAVIDSGIDTDHPEFSGRISEYSYNASEDIRVKDRILENGAYDWSVIEDEYGHGTAVTGVISSAMNNGGIVGIAPEATVITIKADTNENGEFLRSSDLVFGIYYAIECDVSVINMSFSTQTDYFKEAIQLAYDSDIICVAAAGNDESPDLNYPAADPNVIGVGALEADQWTLADFSNYGENTNLVAPGYTYTAQMGGGYKLESGTSVSAPIVSAAVALYMQTDKYATFDKVTEILYASCYDLGDLGKDFLYGFGALDVNAFLLEERGTVTYDMLTDEIDNEEGLFIRGHALQELPEPERLYAVFDGWYYDDTFTQAVDYYTDEFYGDLTLYAKWVNEEDGIPFTYVVLEDGTVEIRSYTGHRRFITVPEKIEGREVSSIGSFAFDNQTRLREVVLPSTLKSIGSYAFMKCTQLSSIDIPEGVFAIGQNAFEECVRLGSVNFPKNSNLKYIFDEAFKNCARLEVLDLPVGVSDFNATAVLGATRLRSITVRRGNAHFMAIDGVLFDYAQTTLVAYPVAHGTEYTIPEGVTVIDKFAFAYAKLRALDLEGIVLINDNAFESSRLVSLTLPESVKKIGKGAFKYNVCLKELNMYCGIEEIPENAFTLCEKLESVVIPNSVVLIDKNAFLYNLSLKFVAFAGGSRLATVGDSAFFGTAIETIVIPATVSSICDSAFSYTNLSKVVFENDSILQKIGMSAFLGAPIEEITLPDHLREIDTNAFAETSLTYVEIPKTVEKIGDGAFAGCGALEEIAVEEENQYYHAVDGVLFSKDNTVLAQYPAGKKDSVYCVPGGVEKIGAYAFFATYDLNHLIIAEGLTELSAFSLCGSGIVEMSLPSTLVRIGESTFEGCHNLTSINIPDNVISIGRNAFSGCSQLAEINFNEMSKISRFGYGTFANSGIVKFTVPANVDSIGQYVFEDCNNLISVTFAENSKLESLPAYMFEGCGSIKEVIFLPGSSLRHLQAHSLEGVSCLTEIDFSNTKLEDVDNFAFRFCDNLTKVVLPESVLSIGRYAFYACDRFSELSLPEKIEHIGSYAFLGTKDMNLYFAADNLPEYLDENWDHGINGYYVGVLAVATSGDYKYAVLRSGNTAIIEYLGSDTVLDLTKVDLGAPIVNIGGGAFKESTVQSVILPDTLVEIQAEAFTYTALEEIVIPSSVKFIGREAFAHTDISSLTFGADSEIRTIEQYAFEGTNDLNIVVLPKSLKTMGVGAFMNSGLIGVVFEDGIELSEIPEKAFMQTKISSVILPDGVTLVNHNAFNNVQTLKSVTFGKNDGIRLMSNAFYHTGLETLYIPENVTYIGEYCFVALANLKEYVVDVNNPNYAAVDGLLTTKTGRKLIAVPGGRTGVLTVPLCVEEIGFGAFEESQLSHIIFNENANILSLGYRAFFKVSGITTITIPASVVSIDYYAFAYCENLKEVVFAEGSKLKGIYEGAFCGDSNLEKIELPDTIVEISDFAFYGCSKIKEIPISETSEIKGIYSYAFAYTGISGEFTTPETLIDIGDYAFLGTKVTKVTVPSIAPKQLIMGIGAFEDCDKITEMTIPFVGASMDDEQITWLGYIFGAGTYKASAAYLPESLKKITLSEGMTTLYPYSFYDCTMLEEIILPHSLSELYQNAFANATARYTFSGEITPILDDYEYAATTAHFGSGLYGEIVFSDRTEHVFGCVPACEGVTRVTFGKNVSTVSGFSGYVNLTEINFLNEVDFTIGSGAFSGCTSLESVTIPDTAKSVSGFENCINLKKVELGYGVEYLGGFSGCQSLKEINIPASVKTIGSYGFEMCTSLTELFIPENVEAIGDYAFCNCYSLEKVIISEGVKHLGGYAFYGNKALKKIVLADSIISLGTNAFAENVALEEIKLPSNLETIGGEAFRNCQSIKEIDIPESVTYIGGYAFTGCNQLATLRIPNYDIEYGVRIACNQYGASGLVSLILGNASVPQTHPLGNNYSTAYITDLEYWITAGLGAAFPNIDALCLNGNLVTDVVLPEGMTEIVNDALAFGHIRSVKIPATLTDIGALAFHGVDRLYFETEDQFCAAITNCSIGQVNEVYIDGKLVTEVIVPEGVTTLNSYSYSIGSLNKITLPSTLTYIAAYAFNGCNNLYEIYNNSSKSLQFGSGVASYAKLIVDAEGNKTYKDPESGFTFVDTPDGFRFTLENGEYTLISYLGKEKTVTLPKDINGNKYKISGVNGAANIIIPEEITDFSFKNNVGLESVVLHNKLTEIPTEAFYGCAALDNVKIPDSVTVVQGFSFCSSLKNIIIPSGVKEVNLSACTSLKNISLPESVTSVSLTDCISLEGITVPYGVTTLNLSGCTSLRSINIPESVATLGLSGCTSLKSIEIPDSVISVNFRECTALESMILPDSIRGDYNALSWRFYGCTSLKSITLPDSITDVGSYAFDGCTSLETVIFGENIKTIHGEAFANCTSLKTLTFPESLERIYGYAFRNCTSLEKVTFGDNIVEIGNDVFRQSDKLLSVNLPASVTGIGKNAFSSNTALIFDENNQSFKYIDGILYDNALTKIIYVSNKVSKNLIIPEGVTAIPDGAFRETDIESIVLPSTLISVGASSFRDCKNLKSVTLSEGMTTIYGSAFRDCTALESIKIPESVTSIKDNAFNGCISLASINIPDSVTSIGEFAFYGCEKLNTLKMGAGVKTVGPAAFDLCNELEHIYISDVKSWVSIGYSERYNTKNAHPMKIGKPKKIYIGGKEISTLIIPEGTTSIGDFSFYNCSGIKSIVIPGTLTTIGGRAFDTCTALESLVIPDNVTEIRGGAFARCSSLKDITIGKGLTVIAEHLFLDCTSIEKIVIPDNITSIYGGTFSGCTMLKDIYLGAGVTSIGGGAFANSNSIENIYVPNVLSWVNIIDMDTFYADFFLLNKNLYIGGELATDIIIPEGVTKIGSYAFANFQNITNIKIPSTVTSIGYRAFMNCPNLETVEIAGDLETIGRQAFWKCTSLESVVISGGTKIIEEQAFKDCSSLETVVLPESLETIQKEAFMYCRLLESITIPSNVTLIQNNAFSCCNWLYEVTNNSSLDIKPGVPEHGNVALSAQVVIDSEGNKIFREGNTNFEYIITEDGFRFIPEGDHYALFGYLGDKEVVVLPETFMGKPYSIASIRGAKTVVIPVNRPIDKNDNLFYAERIIISEGITEIPSYAFLDCTRLKTVYIPESVDSIKYGAFKNCTSLENIIIAGDGKIGYIEHEAFANTAYASNPDNWEHGLLVIGNHVVEVKDDVKYITGIEKFSGGCANYNNAYLLKNALWSNYAGTPSNVETVVLTRLCSVPNLLTLKNVVIRDTVGLTELRTFKDFLSNVTDITVFVEAFDEDLRWDDNFPGWSNGNKVFYGDKWNWVNFYDQNGTLISSTPTLLSQVIRLPILNIEPEGDTAYVVIGWDIDGDGLPDSIPATTAVDIHAYPVVAKVARTHYVEFSDETGTVYSSSVLGYGEVILLPVNPSRKGYTFVEWEGYTAGMTVDSDVTFTAKWEHIGGEHFFSEETTVYPTCTDKGYTISVCYLCDKKIIRNYVDAFGHVYGDSEVILQPTCIEDGKSQKVCLICKETKEETISCPGHNYSTTEITRSTCKEPGVAERTCSVCDRKITTKIGMIPHHYEKKKCGVHQLNHMRHRDPDMLCVIKDGVGYYYSCDGCGKLLTVSSYVNNAGTSSTQSVSCSHDNLTDWTTTAPATCISVAMEGRYCLDCDKTIYIRLGTENGSHVLDDYQMLVKPTCSTIGQEKRNCIYCDYSETRDVPALNHSHSKYGYGKDSHWSICSRCEEAYGHAEHVFQDNACICGLKNIAFVTYADAEIECYIFGNTLTVKNDDACVVAYKDSTTGKFICIIANKTADGHYTFAAPEGVEILYVAVKGDYNGDGKLTDDDVTSLKNAILGKSEGYATEVFIYDITGEGKITALDLALINAAVKGKISIW